MADFISYKGFEWEYETFGNGDEILFVFHGFGSHSSDFKAFEASLGKKYKIVSFSLPYHGRSRINESASEKSISPGELGELIRSYSGQGNITKFSLMGYSLGGKIALKLIELFPGRINTVLLFAPDGIRPNRANDFITGNMLGRKLYKQIMRDPSRFLKIVGVLKKMNLIHEKLSVFLHKSLDTPEKRRQVWDVWMFFRYITPDLSQIRHIINANNIRIHIFLGKHDRIISPSSADNFVKGLKNKNCIHVVDTGHMMMNPKMNEYLLKVIV